MNCNSRVLLVATLAAFAAIATPARADRYINSNFTQNGGTFSVSPAGQLHVNDATLTFTNAATTTGISSLLMQNGTMNVYSGSKVQNTSFAYLGNDWPDPWGLNTVNVVGSGSQWTNGGVHLGKFGNNGVLNIRAGGEVISDWLSVVGGYYYGDDYDTPGNGVVNVSDNDSRWHAQHIWIGDEIGLGTLNVTNGGLVTSAVGIGLVGEVAIRSTGTLVGDGGTIAGNVHNLGGLIAPGPSDFSVGGAKLTIVGELDATLASNRLEFDLGTTAYYDQLLVDGPISLGGVIDVKLLGSFAPTVGSSFNLLSFSSLTDAGFTFDFSDAPLGEGLTWDTSTFLLDGTIHVAPVVPEPSAMVLAGIAAVGILLFHRRKSS